MNNKSSTFHRTEGRKQSHLDLTKSSGWRVPNTAPYRPQPFYLKYYSFFFLHSIRVIHAPNTESTVILKSLAPSMKNTVAYDPTKSPKFPQLCLKPIIRHTYTERVIAQTLLHTCQHTHACVVLTRA